jgi:quinol monooxygenase YgiN
MNRRAMHEKRRTVLTAIAAGVLAAPLAACAATPAIERPTREQQPMYGLIGKIRTQPGQRDAFAAILLRGTGSMPGCLSYIIANDNADADALWVTEVWDSAASHKASLALPAVQQAIATGRPLIAGFAERFETTPLSGPGYT